MPKKHLRLSETNWAAEYLSVCGHICSHTRAHPPKAYRQIPTSQRCDICDRTWEGKAVLKQHGGKHG